MVYSDHLPSQPKDLRYTASLEIPAYLHSGMGVNENFMVTIRRCQKGVQQETVHAIIALDVVLTCDTFVQHLAPTLGVKLTCSKEGSNIPETFRILMHSLLAPFGRASSLAIWA